MKMFVIDGTDFSDCITVPSYKVNSKDIYDEYVDANKIKHRDIHRSQISGTMSMKFFDIDRYYDFLRLLREKKTIEGYVTVSLYVNNLNEVKEADVYIDHDMANVIPVLGMKDNTTIEITITER